MIGYLDSDMEEVEEDDEEEAIINQEEEDSNNNNNGTHKDLQQTNEKGMDE